MFLNQRKLFRESLSILQMIAKDGRWGDFERLHQMHQRIHMRS